MSKAASSCKQRALSLLAAREHSRSELERKLGARGFEPGPVAAALDELERSGLLQAARFAASFVRTRVAKGQGPRRISAELLERGLSESDFAALIDRRAVDWNAVARAACCKRFGSTAPADFKERAKRARFLQYRGFETSQINAALDLHRDSD